MATKLSTAKLNQLAALNDALEIARQEVVDLCESLTYTDFLDKWQVAPALQTWQKAAAAWNEAVADAAVDVRGFMDEHSEKWLDSERGQAYDRWADDLENAAIDTEPLDTLRISLTIDLASGQIEGDVENAEDLLPETPTVPELDA